MMGKKKFEFESSGHFKEAKEIGYKVGKELLKRAGSNFTALWPNFMVIKIFN